MRSPVLTDADDDALVLPGAEAAALVFFVTPSSVPVDGKVRRKARLFLAGDYPDKGVAITAADLEGIAARFAEARKAAPILTEHVRGLHDPLGACVGLHAEGDTLFGMLEFSAATFAHLSERGVDRLSVALVRVSDAKGAGYALKEVSVTASPRVEAARILPPDEAAGRLAAFRAQGRVTPAMEGPLGRLLAAAKRAPLLFADDAGAAEPVDLAAEALALVAAVPVVQERGAALTLTAPRAPAGEEQVRTFAAAFGVDPARVAERLRKGEHS
jgi:hypothetical protein